METKQLKIGILGCAKIADKFVIPAIKNLNDLYVLQGVAASNKDKAISFAGNFETLPFDNYDDLIENGVLDAVYIPLPNALHYSWTKKALEKGLHVLVEKSLACNYADVNELNNIAKDNKLVLVENFQFRFHSQLEYIKVLVNSGYIGELRCVRSSFGFPPFPEPDNIRYQKHLGGGALLDAGAYPLKISQIFLGHDLHVAAANLIYDTDKEVDIWGGAYLKQNNGNLFSEIAFGFDHHYQCNLELWGSKGKIYTGRIFTAPPAYEPEILLENQKGSETVKLNSDHHFENMLKHFYDLVSGKEKINPEYKQNINQSRLIEELRKKAHEKF